MDLLADKGILKSLLQHQSLKTPVLRCSVFFMVQLSHLYMTIGKTIALTIWIFVGQVMPLIFNTLSRFVKFRLELKKVRKTTKTLRYDLNQIPYDYTDK